MICSSEAPARLPREVRPDRTTSSSRLGYGVVSPVLPAYARHFGVSISAATFVITLFALARLCFAPVSGPGGAAAGERRIYVSGLLIVAVSTAACAFAHTYWQLPAVPVWVASARRCSSFRAAGA